MNIFKTKDKETADPYSKKLQCCYTIDKIKNLTCLKDINLF